MLDLPKRMADVLLAVEATLRSCGTGGGSRPVKASCSAAGPSVLISPVRTVAATGLSAAHQHSTRAV